MSDLEFAMEPDPPGSLWIGDPARKIRNLVAWAELIEVRDHNRMVVRAWRDAAIADGWTLEAMFPGHEDVDRAFKLWRDGFHVSGINRPAGDLLPQAQLNAWGPDGLCLLIPIPYDWERLKTGLRRCNNCGAEDVETQRYGFAGRCCADCLPAMRAEHERPGWTK